jgi:hypothetical protein
MPSLTELYVPQPDAPCPCAECQAVTEPGELDVWGLCGRCANLRKAEAEL